MLADSKLPTTFWAEAVSTACYVQNRVLIVKPHNKTPYELFRDKLGLASLDGKSDEGFFVGYSLSSKAFRVYNTRTRKVQENLHIGFLENKPMIEGNGPKWLFDIDSLTQSMNYVPVVAGTFSITLACIQRSFSDLLFKQKMKTSYSEKYFLVIYEGKPHQDHHNMSFMLCYLSQKNKRVSKLLCSTWVEAMQEELLQFKLQKVWILMDLPKGHSEQIGIKVDKEEVQQKKKCIFISQDKYVNEILRKYNYTDVKSASTPIDLEKPLVQDRDAADVDEHLYRSLMYLTASKTQNHGIVSCMCKFTMSYRHQELTSPEQTATALACPKQTAIDKDYSNPVNIASYKDVKLPTDTDRELEDHDGITSIPNLEIFKQLALMGYQTDSDKLTFQKDMQKKQLKTYSNIYLVPSLNNKVFSNIKRLTKGYTRVEIGLFPTMLTLPTPESSPIPSSSPSRITSSPLYYLNLSPLQNPTFVTSTSPEWCRGDYGVGRTAPKGGRLARRDLHDVEYVRGVGGGLLGWGVIRIESLKDDLQKTKKTYNSAFTKLVLRIKKLESKVKTGKARKRARYCSYKYSTARETRSTAGRVVYGRRSKEARKDKGKEIMTEPEPEKKSKKLLEQERLGLEEAIRLQEQVDEEERAQVARDEEIARQLLALDEERVTTDPKTTKDIDWNDPSVQVLGYKNKPKSEAQARKNMIVYLKNQSNYKMKDFEGMSYDEIRPIFEKVWDFNHNFVPMDLEIEKEKKKPAEFQVEQIEKDTTGKRKKSLPRKRTRSTTKRQKVELDDEKEDLKGYLDIVPREDVAADVDSLSTRISIQDIVELYKLIKERYSSLKPEGYDLILCDFYGVHILLMENGIAIHMLTEKKYPLSQEMISKMPSKRLEVDQKSRQAYELLKFIRSQVIEKWTCSKVTLDHLLSEQIPRNIVKALGGRGKRKGKISPKEVLFTKANESLSVPIPEITSDSASECKTQEPLPPLPKLIGVEPASTSNSLISLADLTLNMADLTLDTSVLKKTTQSSVNPSPKKALMILKPFKECKYYGFNDHYSNNCEYYPGCEVCDSIGHEPDDCPKKHLNSRKPRIANKRSTEPTESGYSRHMTGVKQYLPRYSKEPSPKVVLGDDSSRDIKGYGSVNCNGIMFTRVAYVNGLKHNLISISQLCDANFKVLFTKTQGTIFNQKDKVFLIAPRRRDVYVIDMSPFNKKSNTCFFAKASPRVNWLWHKRLSHLNFKNINNLVKHNLVSGLPSLTFSKDKNYSACEKRKHHRASIKTKRSFYISTSLHLCHMDMFRPVKPQTI
ncbi:retrovirus-related pol polyprotein from transposon TNT 1-94 [Tanacetum coccineum]